MADAEAAGRLNARKVREGLVVSAKMEKTVVVSVIDRVSHPRYGKTLQRTNRLYAHDEANEVREGDRVRIQHGFRGPNHAVVTACSTGAHAIGDAARLIMWDDADVMVAGGAEAAVCRLGLAGFAAARALSTGYNDTPDRASRPGRISGSRPRSAPTCPLRPRSVRNCGTGA